MELRSLSKYHELVFAGPWGNCLIQVPLEIFILRNLIKMMTLSRRMGKKNRIKGGCIVGTWPEEFAFMEILHHFSQTHPHRIREAKELEWT